MGVVVASELLECAGVPLGSSNLDDENENQQDQQVKDEEAATDTFIPAEGISAVLVSPHRVLVTGGVLDDDRVLPFSVVRYFDLDPNHGDNHKWTKPLLLRENSKRGKRKRNESTVPVCRMDHTLTLVPDCSKLFLIGGLKVGGKEVGQPCKTVFAFDVKKEVWQSVDVEGATSKAKIDKEHNLGPRFAHSAVYLASLRSDKRSRKSAGHILVYGGYSSCEDRSPSTLLHLYDVRQRKWSLRMPKRGMDAPKLAYHAAGVTESCRYLVIHGGCCSDINDTCVLSPELYVFDIENAEWLQPQLAPNSAEPPSARQRHSIVNGVGKHEGFLILYGGQVSTGKFSNELFVVRINEPVKKGNKVTVFWERHDVYPPPPSQMEVATFRDQADEEDRGSKTAGAAGSMMAVPALNKYLFLGGRYSGGLRANPLLLDATEAEHLDRYEAANGNKAANGVKQKQPSQVKVLDAGASDRDHPSAQRPVSGKTSPPQEKIDWKKEKENKSTSSKRPRAQLSSLPPRPPVAVASIANDPSNVVLPPAKTGANRDTQKTEENPVVPNVGYKDVNDDESSYMEVKPATEIQPRSAASIGTKEQGKENRSVGSDVMDLINRDDDDDDSDFELRRVEDSKHNGDFETPPTKRRRFIHSVKEKQASKAPKTGAIALEDSDDDFVADNTGSDFVAASELARKGKKRAVAKASTRGRGRGRGRGKGPVRGRAAAEAESREMLREQEIEELQRENERVVKQLQAENEKLRKEKGAIDNDNRELNEQMKGLLAEVKSLRGLEKAQTRAKPVTRGNHRLANGEPSSSHDDAEDFATPSQTTEFRPPGAVTVASLRSRIADLEEECEEVGAERDGLSKSLREVEEAKRGLETEVNVLKNKIDKMNVEKETLRKQTVDLRTAATESNVAKENAEKQVRKEEEVNSTLRRELETLRNELHKLESRRVDNDVELSTAQRQMNKIKAQLVEATKKYEQYGSKEKQLKAEMGSQQERVEDLTKLLEGTTSSKQHLEEKNIRLIAELEIVKKDLGIRTIEKDTARQEADRSRAALDREKKISTDAACELTRLQKDLKRLGRERDKLRAYAKKRDASLQQICRTFRHVMPELEKISHSPSYLEEADHMSPQQEENGVEECVAAENGYKSRQLVNDQGLGNEDNDAPVQNGKMERRNEEGMDVTVGHDKNERTGDVREAVEVPDCNGEINEGDEIDSQSPVPDSEDAEDVDEP